MKQMPWVRFFASDWLAGTRGMSAVETGVYITLIATMYERGEPIQEDHPRLSRLCGASVPAFRKALTTLVSEGKITRTQDGLWNDRVEKERSYQSEKSEVGAKAASVRWSKKDCENNGQTDAIALPTQSPRKANQSPDTRYHIEEKEPLRGRDASQDVRKTLFDEGVRILGHMAGLPERRRRPLIAKWLQEAGDDAGKVLAKLRQAEADHVMDVVSWVSKAVRIPPRNWRDEPEYRGVQ